MPDKPDRESRRALGEEFVSRPGFDSVMRLIETLLGEGGCPWDRARKLEDCPEYLEGELREALEAIGSGDDENLEEELGDLLFMVAFTAKIAEKEGRMSVRGMFERLLGKMVYRHPHVFGGEMEATTPGEVLDNWRELKRREKSGGGGDESDGGPEAS
jgi:tetrapyrrole methylase family protein/MazG family protein